MRHQKSELVEVVRENGNQVAAAVGKLGDAIPVLSKGDSSSGTELGTEMAQLKAQEMSGTLAGLGEALRELSTMNDTPWEERGMYEYSSNDSHVHIMHQLVNVQCVEFITKTYVY